MTALRIIVESGSCNCSYGGGMWASTELRPLPDGFGIQYTTNDRRSCADPLIDYNGHRVEGITDLYSMFVTLGDISREDAIHQAADILIREIFRLLHI